MGCLLLVEQEGSEIHFKIERSTKMSKLMDAYCKQWVRCSCLAVDGAFLMPWCGTH